MRGAAVLTRAARRHSAEMAGTGVFGHDTSNGAPFWRRLVAQGLPRGRRTAENIAMVPICDRTTAARVVDMWMRSAAHRRNLLDPALRLTGVGVAVTPHCGRVLITADYAG